MKVKLKRYVINSTRSVSGKVLERRYGYVITIKRHWWKFWKKPRYLKLLYGWQSAIINDLDVNVQLVSNISSATTFREDNSSDYSSKSTAESVIKLLKEQTSRFILA